MERYFSDARASWRIFRRSPALAASAVLALAMGIGFTATMFSIVRGGTRALPFPHPEQIVALTRTVVPRGNDLDPARLRRLYRLVPSATELQRSRCVRGAKHESRRRRQSSRATYRRVSHT